MLPGGASGVRSLVLVAEEVSGRESEPPFGAVASLLGFLVARQTAPDWELENIATVPSLRRKGIGKQLLKALLDAARQTNSQAVFLEVRDSNAAARAFYETAGFQQIGRRKSYYKDPVEDAILYRFDLC